MLDRFNFDNFFVETFLYSGFFGFVFLVLIASLALLFFRSTQRDAIVVCLIYSIWDSGLVGHTLFVSVGILAIAVKGRASNFGKARRAGYALG